MLFLILAAIASLSVLGTAVVFFFPHAPLTLAALLLFAAGYAALSFKRPRAGLLLFCFFLPLFNSTLFSRHLNYFPPAALLFLAFFLGWLFQRIARKDTARLSTPLNAPLIAFSALGFGSAAITMLRYAQFYPFARGVFPLAAINRLDETSLQAVTQIFLVVTVFLAGPALFWAVLHVLKDRRDAVRVLTALAAGIALSVLFGIYQSLGHETLGNQAYYVALRRLNATFMDPNGLGIFLGLALPPIAALVFTTRRRGAAAAGWLLLLAALYVLFLSGSRTGILLLLIAGATATVLFFLRHRRTARKETAFYLQPALVAFIILIAVWPAGSRPAGSGATILGERLSQSLERATAEGIWSVIRSDRWEMWQRALSATSRFPVCGIGLGAYWFEIPNFLGWDPREPFLRDNANSYFFQVSAEMGGIGLLLVLVLLGIVVRQSFRLALLPELDPPGRALATALCGGLCGIVLLFTTGPHTEFMEIQSLFWLLAGIVFSWSRRLEAKKRAGGIAPGAGFRRLFGVACAGLVTMGLTGQMANALTVLSLPERRKTCGLNVEEGFHSWERGSDGTLSRWTTGDARTLVAPTGPFLLFRLYVGHPDAAQKPVTADVFLDGELIRQEVFNRSGETRRVCVPVPETDKAKIEIRLRVSRAWRPARMLPDNTDTRLLGVLVSEFKFARENNP